MSEAWLLTTNYPPVGGGVSRYNFGLVSAARGRIQVAGIDGFAQPPGLDGLRARGAQILWAYRVAKNLGKSTKILVSPPHLAVGVLLARGTFVCFVHGGEWQNYFLGGRLLQMLLHRARLVVVSSNATQNRWLSPALFHKVVVMRPGLSAITPVWIDNAPRQATRRDGADVFRVVAVGRLSVRKGFERLIGAVHLLNRAGVALELRIVGSGVMEDTLRELADSAPYISFDTALSDQELVDAYDNADLFALVPREVTGGEAWEGFGIVYLEAAARGIPILATSSGGISEAVSPEGAELLDERCSDADVAEAIKRLMADPDRLATMSAANLDWARSNAWELRLGLVDRILES